MLQEFGITQEQFRDVVYKQYVKKFGKLGEAVVQSNMEVMTQGFERVKEIKIGALPLPITPACAARRCCRFWRGAGGRPARAQCRSHTAPAGQGPARRSTAINVFDAEFRSHFGYNQPATPLSAMGVIAAATGDTASKYVARRETPLYIPENCTQCMECISVCPDTALPNCSQDLGTLLARPSRATSPIQSSAEDARQAAGDREADAPAHGGRDQDGHAAAHDHSRSHRSPSTDSRPKPRRSSSRSSTRCRWPTRR
jgi:pyruvate-ferredoxin/flavodoxin oxidoreductase